MNEKCCTYLRMLNLPVGLVRNFGFPSLKEGIEHVSNPKCSMSCSETTRLPVAKATTRQCTLLSPRGVLEYGRKQKKELADG